MVCVCVGGGGGLWLLHSQRGCFDGNIVVAISMGKSLSESVSRTLILTGDHCSEKHLQSWHSASLKQAAPSLSFQCFLTVRVANMLHVHTCFFCEQNILVDDLNSILVVWRTPGRICTELNP